MPVSYERAKEIIEYADIHGEDSTINHFCLSRDTISRYRRILNEGIEDNQESIQSSIEYKKNEAQLSVRSVDIRTLEDALSYSNVDLNIWEVDRYIINSWEVHGKNKSEDFEKYTNYQVKVWLKRKTSEFDFDLFKQEFIVDCKDKSLIVPRKKYNFIRKSEKHNILELDIFDLHYGKLAWEKETGMVNYDLKESERVYFDALSYLLDKGSSQDTIEEVLFPIGNDFFNTDTHFPYPQTTKGTIQQDEGRWQKIFHNGVMIMIKAINMCKEIAPVKIYVIPGNHDKQRSFYLGEALDCYYHNDQNVDVNNSAKPHKYYSYGKNLIGFTHKTGNKQNERRLTTLMQNDVPDLWAKTCFHEWHLGDIHHKKEIISTEDIQGIIIRHMRTLAPIDAWENEKFYRSMKGAEAFIFNAEYGLNQIINYNLKY